MEVDGAKLLLCLVAAYISCMHLASPRLMDETYPLLKCNARRSPTPATTDAAAEPLSLSSGRPRALMPVVIVVDGGDGDEQEVSGWVSTSRRRMKAVV